MPKSAPPSLAQTQKLMLDAIRRPLRPGEQMQEGSRDTAERLINPNSRLTSFDRLEIYNQQYWWRLISIFEDDFPGVRAVIGQRSFDRLTISYLEECPSQSWNLRNLGARLPAYLEKYPEATAPHTALALDVAKVEWAVQAAFDDPEDEGIDPQKLATADPSKLKLGLQPYLQLLELRHPVDRLLSKLKKRSMDSESSSNAVGAQKKTRAPRLTSRPLKETLYLAVHRVDLQVYYRRLSPVAYRLLLALRAGETLEGACETALADETGSPEEAAGLVRDSFGTFTSLGWLCKWRGRK